MYIEKYLKQFWRCTRMDSEGDDQTVSEAFDFRKKLTSKNTILSGLRLEYDVDEPGAPAFLAFEYWDLRADELNPGYWQTGHIKDLLPAKNGFIAITGNDEKGETVYIFKKTSVDPFRKFEQKRLAEIEKGVASLVRKHDVIGK